MKIVIIAEVFAKQMGYMESMLPKYLARFGAEVHVITTDLSPYYQTPDFAETYKEFSQKNQLVPGSVELHDGYTLHTLAVATDVTMGAKTSSVASSTFSPSGQGGCSARSRARWINQLRGNTVCPCTEASSRMSATSARTRRGSDGSSTRLSSGTGNAFRTAMSGNNPLSTVPNTIGSKFRRSCSKSRYARGNACLGHRNQLDHQDPQI